MIKHTSQWHRHLGAGRRSGSSGRLWHSQYPRFRVRPPSVRWRFGVASRCFDRKQILRFGHASLWARRGCWSHGRSLRLSQCMRQRYGFRHNSSRHASACPKFATTRRSAAFSSASAVFMARAWVSGYCARPHGFVGAPPRTRHGSRRGRRSLASGNPRDCEQGRTD